MVDQDREALLVATVEAETGLWELVWELNTLHGKDPANLATARRIVQSLLDEDRWWEPPGGNLRAVRAWATEKGRAAYFSSGT